MTTSTFNATSQTRRSPAGNLDTWMFEFQFLNFRLPDDLSNSHRFSLLSRRTSLSVKQDFLEAE
eukprot:CAMPEP_0171434894 /NCGR_PEP_ID=MMETSP0881-20121228/10871_1 /TAXON_ID=67004 /ORGANISM="Thalassiosira weissflogii, Strain CCMP1336" /LENGTH=63 /DNA_ID=CAMNT_0011955801 /DNA_START=411 /DNA_END=600 /DNA_ORIENTATION=+